MFIYTVIAAIAGIVAGILIAVLTKRTEGVEYGNLDTAGRITNIFLIPGYALLSPICLFVGMISEADYDGFLGVIGWIVAVIIASALPVAGLGLGFSVALRKKGRSKLSFVLQFAGFAAMATSFLLFVVFYGNLLSSIN